MTDTPEGFKAARHKLGLSTRQLGDVMRADPTTVRRWEMSDDKTSHRTIPGPVAVLLDWLIGNKPKLPKIRRGRPY